MKPPIEHSEVETADDLVEHFEAMATATAPANSYPTIAPFQTPDGSWQLTIPAVAGSGCQIFRAPTLELLCGKLGQCGWNATKKIRTMNAVLKAMTEVQNSRDDTPPDFVL